MATQKVGIYRKNALGVPSVLVDVTLAENHLAENTVTTNPIEIGSPITDHIIIQPDVLEIISEVSNYDGDELSASAFNLSTRGERAKSAWQQFKKLRNERALLRVVTKHEVYEDMIIVSLDAEHVPGFSGRIRLSAKFQKVDITNLAFNEVAAASLFGTSTFEFTGTGPEIGLSAFGFLNRGNLDTETFESRPDLVDQIALDLANSTVASVSDLEQDIEFLVGLYTDAMEILNMDSSINNIFNSTLLKGTFASLTFRVAWNSQTRSWGFDILDASGAVLIGSRTISPGVSMLKGFPSLQRQLGDFIVMRNTTANKDLENRLALGEQPLMDLTAKSDYYIINLAPGVLDAAQESVQGVSKPLNFELEAQGYRVFKGEEPKVTESDEQKVTESSEDKITEKGS